MLRGSRNVAFQVRVRSDDHRNTQGTISGIARNLRFIPKHDQVCVGRESKDVVDDNINHRGARVVLLTMRLIDTWKAPSVDVDYDTFVLRFQENAID